VAIGATSSRQNKAGGGRQALPRHLKRERIVHDLAEGEKHCGRCAQALRRIGEETSERYEYVPASLTVIEKVCVKYACACTIRTAGKPSQPIEKSNAGRDSAGARHREQARRSFAAAALAGPFDVAVDPAGNLYIADTDRIRKVSTNGIIESIAGGGTPADGLGDNGPALVGIAVDGAGNLYLADRSNSRIRKVGTDGTISTVAGGGRPASGNGDGGLATNATLSAPYGVAVDGMGDVIICDQGAAEHPGPFGVIEGGRKRAPGERVIIQYPIRLFGIEGGRNRRGYHSRAQAGRSDNIIEIPAVMRSSAKRRAR
jgi:hypothetical protein